MPNWKKCVIDASLSNEEGFCFCPVDDQDNIVTGMNYIQASIPEDMELVSIIHDNHEEAKRFMDTYGVQIAAMQDTWKKEQDEKTE